MTGRVIPTLPEDPEEVESIDFFVEVLWAAAMARYLDERELTERETIDVYTAGSVMVANAMVHQGGADPEEVMAQFDRDPELTLALGAELQLHVGFTWEDGFACGVTIERREDDDE